MTIDLSTLRKNTEPPPPIDEAAAPFLDVAGAAWAKTTVETDAWGYEARMRWGLVNEMIGRLTPDSRGTVTRQMNGRRFADPLAATTDLVLREVAREAAADPRGWAGYPTDPLQLQDRIDRQRRAQADEAQAVLDREGGAFAEFLGSAARTTIDPVNLATIPFGLEGGIGRVIAGEALLNGVAEGLNVPRERQVAQDLGLPEPDMATRVLAGAAFGGVLAGVAHGAVRFGAHLLEKRRAAGATTPEGLLAQEHEADLQARQDEMTGEMTPGQAAKASAQRPTPGAMPSMSDFDFRPGGNASPKTNRIGYVYGRLLERGYSPEAAAGIVGNGMAEAGPRMNPRAIGDGGNAFGMFQWNGPRKLALEAFAAKRGKDPGDIDIQLDFLDYEMTGPEAAAGARIKAAKTAEEAAILMSRLFERPGIPREGARIGHAREIYAQFTGGSIPSFTGRMPDTGSEVPVFDTSRGYTGAGEVTAGDTRVPVTYEVVNASLLRRASGDLQPRDRSRAASDAQVAEIAARLDPGRLGPSPEADRGAPIVGPDNVIESGNGRVMAIERAYELHPDRAAAYRAMIEQTTGQSIPADIARPVLIARRQGELTPEARQRFVNEANTSAVARMSPTERARSDATLIDDAALRLFEPGHPVSSPVNRSFVRGALAALPQAERSGLTDAGGALNSEGVRRLQNALFARAWAAPDIVARAAETDAGELRSLIEALTDAAPAWAALRADIAAGLVRPEMDIGDHVLEAMRMIALARDQAARDGVSVKTALAEMLDQVDLLDGAISPLTAALLRKFWRNGRAAPSADVAEFLNRYAAEARKIGTTETSLFGDAPGPADALRAIDPTTFGSLPEDLGLARRFATTAEAKAITGQAQPENAFAKGADSPEAEAADELAAETLHGTEEKASDRASLMALTAAERDNIARASRDFLDSTIQMTADGPAVRIADILDEIEADRNLADVLHLCNPGVGT